jgi:hypothetical protein
VCDDGFKVLEHWYLNKLSCDDKSVLNLIRVLIGDIASVSPFIKLILMHLLQLILHDDSQRIIYYLLFEKTRNHLKSFINVLYDKVSQFVFATNTAGIIAVKDKWIIQLRLFDILWEVNGAIIKDILIL